jgi:cytochrome c6
MLAFVLAVSSFTGPMATRSAFNKAAVQMSVQDNVKAGLAAAALAIAMPAMAADLANGESVFQGNCAACHAGGQNSVQVEKTLELSSLKSYLANFNGDESAIITQVTNGKNAMPAFGGRLEDEEISVRAATRTGLASPATPFPSRARPSHRADLHAHSPPPHAPILVARRARAHQDVAAYVLSKAKAGW